MIAPIVLTAAAVDANRIAVDLVQVPDSELDRIRSLLAAVLPRIGIPQDLGHVADEVHVLVESPVVAIAALRRHLGEHGIELRDVTQRAVVVTADTITDEQIRDLYSAGTIHIDLKDMAMFGSQGEREVARASCAAAWNVRHQRPGLTAADVLALARSLGVPAFDVPAAGPIPRKILLASLWLDLRDPDIRTALVQMHRRGEIVLVRVDMVPSCRLGMVSRGLPSSLLDESELRDGGVVYHALEVRS